MAAVVEWVAVAARPERLLALIRDYNQRPRFLPDGWRRLRGFGPDRGLGAQMEIEARIGPMATTHLVQLLSEGDDFIDEGPPGGENYLTTWTVQARGEDTIVQVEMRFGYGGIVGEFFVRRRLRRALRQMLQRLKAIAEAR
ncbi:MAG TPA: SRPBCC family protein [Dehalococcoidia bacterium]|nr:SRPBCC family protein [Dehalococcoidia bacterium]